MTRSEELIGRDPELMTLTSALDRVREAEPGFWLITGEAGIGKSRLLGAFALRAGAAGLRVVTGTATETGRNVPYLPLVAPLRRVLESPGPVGRSPGRDLAAATVSLAIHGGGAGVEAGSLDTARLFEAIHDLLVRSPTLLAIDDVHWADASTMAVLDYLAHRVSSAPLLVLACAREDPRLPRLAIADGRRFVPLPLERLARNDVGRLAQQLASRRLSSDEVDWLHRRSAGNPFFLEQLLDGISDGGREHGGGTARGADPDPDVPTALRVMLLGRIEGLPVSTAPVLEGLAVVGVPAATELLSEVVDLPADQVRAALRESTAAGVTVATPNGHAFRHPLFGEVVTAGLPGPERRRLHARTATALLGIGDAAAIAEHWWLAEAPEAWQGARVAAAAAARGFAFAEVRTHLERAIATWPDDAPGVGEAMLQAAHAAWVTGDPGGAVELAGRAGFLDPDRADGALAVASYLWDAGRRAEATIAFERAAALLARDPSPGRRARGEWAAGRAAVASGRPRAAADHGLRGAELAREAGATDVQAEALALAGISLGFDGNFEGIPFLERAAMLGLELGAPHIVGHTHQFLVDLLGLAGRSDDARQTAEQGIAACDRLGTARTHGSDLRGRLALLLIDRGRWAEADPVLERADRRALPLLAQAILAIRRGSFATASSLTHDAGSAGSIGGPGALGGWLELVQAELTWLQGDAAGSARMLEAVPAMPGVWGRDVAAWRERWRARLGLIEEGNLDETLATAKAHPDAAVAAAIAAEVGACVPGQGDLRQPDAWAAAVTAWEEAQRPWEAAFAGLALAVAWFAAREGRRGREALERVEVTASVIEAAPLVQRIDDLARRARVKVRASRPAPDPDAPTSRELDVLRLLAEGRTNPQIAHALFLSPKTVGIHVSRLLDKLGASTRGEAVAVARRRGLIG